MTTDIKACPVFTRWQIRCSECGITFYVDSKPDDTREDILNLDAIKCEYHPSEDSVLTLE